ncbi:MAG: efflux RND transporter periplasmic adaptor subunit [Verrucomicrobiota bacterium]
MSAVKYLLPSIIIGGLGVASVSCERPKPAVEFAAVSQPVVPPTTPTPESKPEPPPVLRKKATDDVFAVGVIEANTQSISLGAPLAGVVQEVRVVTGQRVDKGALLLKLDTRHLTAALSRAQAEVAAREAEVETAKARVTVAETQSRAAEDLLRMLKNTGIGTVSAEEISRRSHAAETAAGVLDAARATLLTADAGVKGAKAAMGQVEIDISRSSIIAPIKGTILQVNIRAGESINAGPATVPWLQMGNTEPLHLRVDVPEQDVWRVAPDAVAEASLRGNPDLKVALKFVRIEPTMTPKRSNAGDAPDRLDTRVLQVVYSVEAGKVPLFVGQPLDVVIHPKAEAPASISAPAKTP